MCHKFSQRLICNVIQRIILFVSEVKIANGPDLDFTNHLPLTRGRTTVFVTRVKRIFVHDVCNCE